MVRLSRPVPVWSLDLLALKLMIMLIAVIEVCMVLSAAWVFT